ncbi:MAG: hypothetical protein EOQ42_28440 [Mesorhizobium sp.]|nr:MAG: hypothetical protein EOQ42_28440 [Mesorhizobium sp.]TGQ36871.1 hypothetical protein EN859_020830 [Mesorhizobium sp. M00.F.Ca.ET.216.01.1.1]
MTWRWDKMIREGNTTPAWLANDFNANRRHRGSGKLGAIVSGEASASTSISSRKAAIARFTRVGRRAVALRTKKPAAAPVIPFCQAKCRRGPLR